MKIAGIGEDRQHELVYQIMDYVKTFDNKASPAENSAKVFLKCYELIGNDDPYKEVKKHSNDLALELYPRLKKTLGTSEDKLYDALKISVAGNIIDLGIHRSFNIEEGLRHSMETGFSIDHYDRFLKKLESVDEVLFLGDNAGEIVFDKLLVEVLANMGKKITYVVKAGPVLNDATMEDVIYVGMDKLAEVTTNGSNYLGSCLGKVSDEFLELLHEARLVIAKGHANFESLEDKEVARDRIFFLLKIKCEEVANTAGAKVGDVVFL